MLRQSNSFLLPSFAPLHFTLLISMDFVLNCERRQFVENFILFSYTDIIIIIYLGIIKDIGASLK